MIEIWGIVEYWTNGYYMMAQKIGPHSLPMVRSDICPSLSATRPPSSSSSWSMKRWRTKLHRPG
ncbi:hypothetical protein BLOT_005574 [Blomia tropicalis]|nr:hypothetical protein BLOT_005574 [Blomia tropicalis]